MLKACSVASIFYNKLLRAIATEASSHTAIFPLFCCTRCYKCVCTLPTLCNDVRCLLPTLSQFACSFALSAVDHFNGKCVCMYVQRLAHMSSIPCCCRVLNPIPLHPGVRRPPAHLKQSRSSKTKLEPDTSNAAAAAAAPSLAAPPASAKKGRKRKADTALPDSTHAELSDADKDAAVETAMTGSGQRRGKGRKAAGKQPMNDNAGKATARGKARGKGRKLKRASAAEDEADLQLQDDLAAVCAASLSEAQAVAQQVADKATKAKRLGDIELENQLAMALASTAAEAEHRARHQPKATQVHSHATLPQPSASYTGKPTLGESWSRSSGGPCQICICLHCFRVSCIFKSKLLPATALDCNRRSDVLLHSLALLDLQIGKTYLSHSCPQHINAPCLALLPLQGSL